MLISHRKKFIFPKTVKTAGTSVESYYEPFCMDEGDWEEQHFRDEYVSESGIVGRRGPCKNKSTYYNHMSAEKIKGMAGNHIWDNYFKFTVIRNPYSKLVSGWYFFNHQEQNKEMDERSSKIAIHYCLTKIKKKFLNKNALSVLRKFKNFASGY